MNNEGHDGGEMDLDLGFLMYGRAAVGLVMCGGARLHGVRCYATGINTSFIHSDAVASVGLYRKNKNIF